MSLETYSMVTLKIVLMCSSYREFWVPHLIMLYSENIDVQEGGEKHNRTRRVFIRPRSEWNWVRGHDIPPSLIMVICPIHRKTTVILFKMLGIERAWKNQGSVDPRPRQIFITKSRRLADKVEGEYVNLLLSLYDDADMSVNDRDHIRRWNTRKKQGTFDPDDGGNYRNDLPQRFDLLLDNHFPLFVTLDTVSIIRHS